MNGSRRALLVVAVLGLASAVSAQEGSRAAQVTDQILARAASFAPDAEVAPARSALFRGDLADVRALIEELASLGDAAVPSFTRLLRARSAHLRANAAWGLSLVGGPAIVAPLVRVASDRHDGVRFQVALALGFSASAAALEPLNALAGDENAAVREAAVRTGGMLRDILAAESLPTAADRVAGLVQLAYGEPACQRIVRYGAEAVGPLIQALDSQDRSVVVGAAECLAKIGDARGLEPLWSKFEASLNGEAETKFAYHLSRYAGPEVWPYLQKLLGCKNVAAQYYALERLVTFEHPERLKTLSDYIAAQLAAGAHQTVIRGPQTDVNPLAEACRVLGLVGDASSVAVLDRVIAEAPSADKSILKPVAEQAKTQLQRRLGQG